MEKYYVWLLMVMRAANPRIHKLIECYGSAEKAYLALQDGCHEIMKPDEITRAKSTPLSKAESVVEKCERRGQKIITLDSPDYPERLKNIFNPPALLFVYGDISGLDDELCITGVGARNITPYIDKLASRVCMDLAALDIVLVSGMAYGTDSVVHKASIECGARGIGVLGCGLDFEYPKETFPLREKLVLNGGACISELLPSANSFREYFHARNRIMSGLSQGTIIFQAGKRSGTLITANYAIQQSRELFCVPPADVFAPEYAGVVQYLRDGAIPLFNHDDVINQYIAFFINKKRNLETITKEKGKLLAVRCSRSRNASKKSNKSLRKITEKPDYSNLPPIQQKVAAFLSDGAKSLDAIERNCIDDGTDAFELLLDMEIGGIVEAKAGNYYELRETSAHAEPEQTEKNEEVDVSSLPEEQRRVVELLTEKEVMNIDAIETQGRFSGDEINELLLDMELEGIIEMLPPGNNYRLKRR